MSYASLETFCRLLTALFSGLAIAAGYGSFYYGKLAKSESKASEREYQEEQFSDAKLQRDEHHISLSHQLDLVKLELKDYILEGNKAIIEETKDTKWNFREGTTLLVVSPPKKGTLTLRTTSKDLKAYLDFVVSLKSVEFSYFHPDLGTISKTAPVYEKDLQNQKNALIVMFHWSFKDHKVGININGDERG